MEIRRVLTEELMREVRRLQVRTRRRVDGLFAGEYHSAFKGRGMEFADVREYEPGDDVRAIDWNVTARSGRTFIKRFVEERELNVVLAVDLSASGELGSGREEGAKTKRRLAIEAAAVLALVASMNGDRVGLAVFTERLELALPAGKGRRHIQRLLRELLNFEPEHRGTDIAAGLTGLGHALHRRGIVFVISDFLQPSGAAPIAAPLRLLSAHHEVVAVQISDPRESQLPDAGLVRIADAETGQTRWIDTSSRRVRDAFAASASAREGSLKRLFASANADRVCLSTDRPFVPEFARYFRLKERRR